MTETGALTWWKGHGAENDFLVLSDPAGVLDLTPALVRELCDRRRGVGADGLLRAVRSSEHPHGRAMAPHAEWFMDYWNPDGTQGQMCGNGIRVFARWLTQVQRVDAGPLAIATRAGGRTVHPDSETGLITVEMGTPVLLSTGSLTVTAEGRSWPGTAVDTGNPHAVVFVSDLADAGSLLAPPLVEPADAFPDGVTIDFVASRSDDLLAVRVHERGAGETRACGTGACAAVAAWRHRTGQEGPHDYTVSLPGGELKVRVSRDDTMQLTGPAVLTAWGKANVGPRGQ